MHSKSIFKPFIAVLVCLVLVGQGCTKGSDPAAVAAAKKTDINVWGVIDDVDVYEDVFRDYRQLHPFITVNYRRFTLEEYEGELLNAMAEDRGPDIFLIHNTWVGKYMPKILPMPLSTKVASQVVVGTIKKEVQYQLNTVPTVTVRQFKSDYPDVVAQDFIKTVNVSTVADKRDLQQRIVAIPMSVDTLGLYVNKDLLNAAGIATIPETWDDFQDAVKKLVKQNSQGNIIQAGAALGTGNNVERAPDILSALMMQNGAEMSAADGTPTFNKIPPVLSELRDTPPAFQALSFYTDFANPAKDVYTWNNKQPNSLDAFIQGKVAFFFGYGYHMPVIKARAPKLNLAIAKLPQIPGNPEANFANYWAWTVSKKTKTSDLSWNLLNFMRTPDENIKFLTAAKRPAALKSQLPGQLEDENIGVFSAQVLTSKSWYRGDDPRAVDAAFVAMIEDALLYGPEEISKIVNTAVNKVSQTVPRGVVY